MEESIMEGAENMSIFHKLNERNTSILQRLKGHLSDVNCCDFAPNFTLVTGSSDKTVQVWDWTKGNGYIQRENSPLRNHKYQVTCVKVSPHGTMMASSSIDGTTLLWNLQSLNRIFTMKQVNGDAVRVCSFSPDSTLLVTAGNNGAICIWDLVHRILIRTIVEHEGTTQGLSFTPDCQFLVTACSLEVINIWYLQDLIDTTLEENAQCTPVARIDNVHDMGVFSIDISRHIELEEDSHLIRNYFMASSGCNDIINIWKITSKTSIKNKHFGANDVSIHLNRVLEGHTSSVTCVKYSNNTTQYLISSSLDKTIKIWNTQNGACLVTLTGHQRYVNCVAFSRDSTLIASGSNDKSIIIWNLTNGKITLETELFQSIININNTNGKAVEMQLTNEHLNDNGADEAIVLEKLDDIFGGSVNTCCFYGSNLLAAGSSDNLVRLFRILDENNNIEELDHSPLEGHAYSVNYVEFSKDGSKLASSSFDGCTFIWNPETGEKYFTLSQNSSSTRVCRFSPSGNFIVTAGDDEKTIIWNLETVEKMSILKGHMDSITSACISPDGKILITVSWNADFRIWSTETFQCIYVKEDVHDAGIQGSDFSDNLEPIPHIVYDGDLYLLATCGNDSTVKLWKINRKIKSIKSDTSTNLIEVNLWRTLRGHGGHVTSVKFSPLLGEMVCSTATDGQARLWSVYDGNCFYVLDHDSMVTSCTFNTSCSLLATGCIDRTLWIWKLPQQLVSQTVIGNKLKSRTKTLADWSNADVLMWLKEINMGHISENVQNTRLDGKKLVTLTNEVICSGLDLDDRTSLIMLNELKWLKRLDRQFESPSITTNLNALNTSIPDEFLCPITHEIMMQPVTCSDGFTYEKHAIAEWFMAGKFTSPMTNETLSNTSFTSNFQLRDAIRQFLEENDDK